jgi:rhodanese-related sulfurtransferase
MAYDYEDEVLPYTTIGTDDAKRMIDEGVRIIDVRTPDEWNYGHIEQATLIPIQGIYSFGKALKEQNLPLDEELIFVCGSGQRSASASEIASLLGFTKVNNLARGMNGWVNRGYPIER